MDKIGFVITAGGIGKRMGSAIPKQFIELCGRPVLIHTLERISMSCSQAEIVVVLPEEWISKWKELCMKYCCTTPHKVVSGGSERFHSVKNGIKALEKTDYIAIHDGVRPIITKKLVDTLLDSAISHGTAIPAIKPVDSMRTISGIGENSPVDRDKYVMIQTPQVFRSEWLSNAYNCNYSDKFTDDASVVEAAGYKINLVEGDRKNIKITTTEDLLFAETFLNIEKQTK